MVIKQLAKKMLSDDMKLKLKKIASIDKNRKLLKKHKTVSAYQKGRYPQGINLIGDISAETGLGQSMRILAAILEHGNIPFCVKQVNLHGELEHNDTAWRHKQAEQPQYSINLIHSIPETWAVDYCGMDKRILDYRYNIAYWLWELKEFPKRWLPCIDTVDEIWTPSEFISESIRKRTDKPVITVPYAIDIQREGLYEREHFGLPGNKFLFLTMYDFISISERKNPQAVIDAYVKAFPVEDEHVGLVIKVNHGQEDKLLALQKKLQDYKNVYFITRNLTRKEVDSLLNTADALVSLHRSEGFGLPVAEAMALGKPVITTNWSATTEFADETRACPVNYRLIKLKKTIGPYEKGNFWADADTSHAAEYMRRLWNDKEYRGEIGRNAQKYVSESLTYGRAAGIIKDRLREIDEKNSIR